MGELVRCAVCGAVVEGRALKGHELDARPVKHRHKGNPCNGIHYKGLWHDPQGGPSYG
jgi:hypothetical protein